MAHARLLRTAGAAGLLTALFALPMSTSAHEGFDANGVATRHYEVFRLFLSRAFDPNAVPQPEGPSYGVVVADLQVNPLEVAFFRVSDNFVPDEVGGPAFVNMDFHAESVDPTVDFVLDGAQVSNTVTGRGHFNDYEFTVGPPSGF